MYTLTRLNSIDDMTRICYRRTVSQQRTLAAAFNTCKAYEMRLKAF